MSRGTEKRARTSHLTIRLTPEERAAIDAAADRAGLTAGSHARNLLLGAPAPRAVRRPPVDRSLLARLLGQLGRIGSNLNQIARMANSGANTDAGELASSLENLETMRDAVLKALGRAP